MNVTCNKCGCELEEKGALIISPPRKDDVGKYDTVDKIHICVRCWNGVLDWLHGYYDQGNI